MRIRDTVAWSTALARASAAWATTCGFMDSACARTAARPVSDAIMESTLESRSVPDSPCAAACSVKRWRTMSVASSICAWVAVTPRREAAAIMSLALPLRLDAMPARAWRSPAACMDAMPDSVRTLPRARARASAMLRSGWPAMILSRSAAMRRSSTARASGPRAATRRSMAAM